MPQRLFPEVEQEVSRLRLSKRSFSGHLSFRDSCNGEFSLVQDFSSIRSVPPVATHSCSSSPEKRTDLFADASNAANTSSGVDTVRKPGSMDEKPENFKIKPRFIPFTETEMSQLSGVGPKIAVSANHEESTSPGYIATTTDTSLRGAVKDNGLFTSTSTKAMDTFCSFSRKVTTVTSKTAHSLTTVAKGIAGGARGQ